MRKRMESAIRLPDGVKTILGRLADAGYEAFAVGGCIRDMLMGREPEDWDITTQAAPETVKSLFPRTIDTGLQHGTVTVMLHGEGYEVTTYRIDGEYEDARHPREVFFTGDLLEDLKRRDFTINAMAYNEEKGLVDVFGGRQDLCGKRIRCVGDPRDRFSEDALRMLRAVRFSAQLGFEVEKETREAVKELAPAIAKVSAERIQAEMVKLLLSQNPDRLRLAYQLGLTHIVLPEFDRMMETPQRTPHHCFSVGEHTICAVENIRRDKVLRLTMLLHDVAKPVCRRTDERGRDHFHGHPAEGARMAVEILRRMKFDNDTVAAVKHLIFWHDDRPPADERHVRRAVSRIGGGYYPLLLEVKRADILAQSSYRQQEKLATLDAYGSLYRKILEESQCVTLSDLAVNGRDLIAMGMKPGRAVGELLAGLLDHVLDVPEDNERTRLLELAKKIHKNQTPS